MSHITHSIYILRVSFLSLKCMRYISQSSAFLSRFWELSPPSQTSPEILVVGGTPGIENKIVSWLNKISKEQHFSIIILCYIWLIATALLLSSDNSFPTLTTACSLHMHGVSCCVDGKILIKRFPREIKI